MTYFCTKCNKYHSDNYHLHKQYKSEKNTDFLEETITKIVKILDEWSYYMERHVLTFKRDSSKDFRDLIEYWLKKEKV